MSNVHLSRSLARLRNEVNARFPNRDKESDGWLGDAEHRARKSDHNPDDNGSVNAIDVDKDGIDVPDLVRVAIHDFRTNYVIWNGRIWTRSTGKWHTYTGTNKHDHHVHISILHGSKYEDDGRPWGYYRPAPKPARIAPPKPAPHPRTPPPRPAKTVHNASSPVHKPIENVAKEVIDGKWGNGDARVRKLRNAGYDPVIVQREVNRQLAKRR